MTTKYDHPTQKALDAWKENNPPGPTLTDAFYAGFRAALNGNSNGANAGRSHMKIKQITFKIICVILVTLMVGLVAGILWAGGTL